MKAVAEVEFRPGTVEDVIVRDLHKLADERGWLAEIFRQDELPAECHPVMAYVSMSLPGVTRGPHLHLDQADLFAFIGGSNFKVRIWDTRRESPTYGCEMTILVSEDHPLSILIPQGLVHAYKNVGEKPGLVINAPNRLYAGQERRETVDEIRYEDHANHPFLLDGI
jgi:dTDP-4-dehydrorhamnose 3,5-epimerase